MAVCENCGAKLGDPDVHGNLICQSCGRVRFPGDEATGLAGDETTGFAGDDATRPGSSGAAQPGVSPPRPVTGFSGVPTNTLSSGTITTAPRTSGGAAAAAGFGCLLPFFVAVAVLVSGIVAYVVFGARDVIDQAGRFTATSDRDVVGESLLALPGEPGGRASFIALTRRYDQRRARTEAELVRLDEGEREPAWVSPPLGEDVSLVPMATDGASVFTVADRRLVAVNADDGTVRWEQPLSDRVTPACEGCLFALSDRAVVQTIDGMLHAFDGATGAPAWQRRLETTSALVRDVGTGLAVIDRGELGTGVAVLDAATGAETAAFVPSCVRADGLYGGTVDSSAIVVPAPGESALHLGFGLSPACWQRWDTATGQLSWSTRLDDGYLTTSFGGTGSVAGGWLVFASQDDVGAIDTTTGAYVPFAGGADREVYPLGADGTTAAFWSKNTRGTASFEVWGFDLASGERRWAHAMGEVTPAVLAASSIVSTDETLVLGGVDGTAVRLVSITGGDPHEITSTVLDLSSGAVRSAGAFAMPAEIGVFTVEPAPWRGTAAVFSADDRLLLVDSDTGTLRWTWPS